MKRLFFTILIILLILNLTLCKNSKDIEAPPEPEKIELLLNNDFEEGKVFPDEWNIINPDSSGFSCTLDSSIAFSGEKSGRIYRPTNKDPFSFFRQNIYTFPKNIEMYLSVYIKTENVSEGSAMIILRADDEENQCVAFATTQNENIINGTQSWDKYSVSAEIPENAHVIYVYLLHDGNGTVWFDNASLFYIGMLGEVQ